MSLAVEEVEVERLELDLLVALEGAGFAVELLDCLRHSSAWRVLTLTGYLAPVCCA